MRVEISVLLGYAHELSLGILYALTIQMLLIERVIIYAIVGERLQATKLKSFSHIFALFVTELFDFLPVFHTKCKTKKPFVYDDLKKKHTHT